MFILMCCICRISIGSLDAVDIPTRQASYSMRGFGSTECLIPSPQANAIEFKTASFSWHTSGISLEEESQLVGGGEVLQNLNLAIPEGKLVVVHGAVGSGTYLSNCQSENRLTRHPRYVCRPSQCLKPFVVLLCPSMKSCCAR